ncbi:MAG: hypothetical protein CO185_00530 [Candidatus Zambryskibacteria bacterium CG_4_9_14_3_um_filter_42_15]|uniref:Type II secretion system protein GspF domain-containing protein n=1 Tax=Candidatus Zambryskibacteria bacterium CG_4_9_14_3_um_filter_42_15 TaxID=1975112 RepID=A0A2M7WSU7_9BACT|nr:MAG: hypothetical protein CO185_00530 [Candidatus Zambryskibacteria bacterium CG_4_9_14_3_um_filter_42_15]
MNKSSNISKLTSKLTKKNLKDLKFSLFRPSMSVKEQAVFLKRLSLLVKGGVRLFEAIAMLEDQMSSAANKRMFGQIRHDIANGQFLHKSMKKFSKVFGQFTINIIRVGETAGTLSKNLKYLADEMEKKRQLQQKLIGALVYPLVIIVAALGISALMTVFLFPKLLPIFQSLNVPLPLSTKILLFISNILINHWLFLLVGLALLVIIFIFLMRLKPFKYAMHGFSLKLPVIGPMLQHYHLTNICRIAGTLFKSQVHVVEAIEVTAETTTNLVYRDRLEKLAAVITMGTKISSFFEKHPKLFPGMLSNMIAVGEKTGSLSDTLIYLGEIHESELDEQTKRLSSIIEPVLMIGVGIMVGFIAISIITPIYEVTQHLNPR